MRSTLLNLTICFGFVSLAAAAEPQVVYVLLNGDAQGELESMLLDGKPIEATPDGKLSRFDVLQSRVRSMMENSDGTRKANEFTAEVHVNPSTLKYKFVSQAIIAISRYKLEGRAEAVPLIEKVKIISSKNAATK